MSSFPTQQRVTAPEVAPKAAPEVVAPEMTSFMNDDDDNDNKKRPRDEECNDDDGQPPPTKRQHDSQNFVNFVDEFCEKFSQRMKKYLLQTKEEREEEEVEEEEDPFKLMRDMNEYLIESGSTELTDFWDEVLDEMKNGKQ